MPSTTERQRKFFSAVMGCKKDPKTCTSKTKKVAKSMTKKTIKDFLKIKK